MKEEKDIAIILGSKSDLPFAEFAEETLEYFKVSYEINILSAHRDTEALIEYVKSLNKRNIQVVITICGMAAHLPGIVSAITNLPVIGVPLSSGSLRGVESILSMLEMPKGTPVATMGLNKSGVINACLLAVRILALKKTELRRSLDGYRDSLRR